MSEKKIRDNYSFQEFDYQMKSLKPFELIYKIRSVFGMKNSNEKTMLTIKEMQAEYKKLKFTPDAFNEYFSERGWIAYESMNFPLMFEAVELARDGKLDEAENALVEYYDAENLGFLVNRLIGIDEFRPRMDLTKKALNDYLEGRYYACIPLVLMMIDGFVNDIEDKGFFASGIDLTIWDTIAAHSTGLNKLTAIFGKSRKKTTTDAIDLPYRNGILHGRDLNYDNKLVAAKAWAALFALADWARAAKSKKGQDIKEFRPPTFKESIQSLTESIETMQNIEKQKQLLNEWKPRALEIGVDIPAKGNSSEYSDNSPEKTLIEFFDFLQNKNYGKVALLTTKLVRSKDSISKRAGRMRDIFSGKNLFDYQIEAIRDEAAAISEIDTKLTFEVEGNNIEVNRTFRLIYEDENCSPIIRGLSNGEWRILLNVYDFEYLKI